MKMEHLTWQDVKKEPKIEKKNGGSMLFKDFNLTLRFTLCARIVRGGYTREEADHSKTELVEVSAAQIINDIVSEYSNDNLWQHTVGHSRRDNLDMLPEMEPVRDSFFLIYSPISLDNVFVDTGTFPCHGGNAGNRGIKVHKGDRHLAIMVNGEETRHWFFAFRGKPGIPFILCGDPEGASVDYNGSINIGNFSFVPFKDQWPLPLLDVSKYKCWAEEAALIDELLEPGDANILSILIYCEQPYKGIGKMLAKRIEAIKAVHNKIMPTFQ